METAALSIHQQQERLSLKEAVLFRKLRNDQKQNAHQDRPTRRPSVGAECPSMETVTDAELKEEKPDEIRSKLLKNRRKLDQLLQNTPDLLKSKQDSEETQNEDLKKQAPNLSLKFYQSEESKRDDSSKNSSADDEMNEPVDDFSLQLSEDDSSQNSTSLNDQHDSFKENKLSNPTKMKSEVIIKPSRASSLREHQSSVTSSSGGLYYEIAKPKPPPRARKSKVGPSVHKQIDIDPKDAKSILLKRANSTNSTASSNGTSKTEESQLKKTGARTPSFEKNGVVNSIDNSLMEKAGYITGPENVVSNRPGDSSRSNILSKSDTSSHTYSTSGYFSPRGGSSSLSPSNSNASSTASSATSLKIHSGRSSRQSHNSQISTKNDTEMTSAKTDKDADLESNLDEEEVFPVKSWVESSEYANLVQQNNNKEPDNAAIDERSNSSAEDSSSQSDAFKVPAQPLPAKQPVRKKPIVVNRISMVEQPQAADLKSRTRILPNGVKLRIPGNRPKKSDASRNSRAFALQLKQLSEESSSPPRERKPSSNPFNPRSHRSISTAATPTPLKSIPVQNVTETDGGFSETYNLKNKRPSTGKLYNTISGATGRHLSASSTFFNDEHDNFSSNNNNKEQRGLFRTPTDAYDGSTWSLNPSSSNGETAQPAARRKSSITNRLKGALSFQNIKKAISMERLNEDEKMRSLSHSYLNEFGEDISSPRLRSQAYGSNSAAPTPGGMRKAPSISSIFTTVRMRKRKSRERRAAKLRNTIAVDPKDMPEIEYSSDSTSTTSSVSTINSSPASRKVSTPGHARSVGRVLEMNAKEETLLIEMEKPSNGPFSFYIARRKETGNVYISRMNDSYPSKMYVGLMKLGDEITEVNGLKVDQMSIDEIYDIIFENKNLLLRIKPSQIHVV